MFNGTVFVRFSIAIGTNKKIIASGETGEKTVPAQAGAVLLFPVLYL